MGPTPRTHNRPASNQPQAPGPERSTPARAPETPIRSTTHPCHPGVMPEGDTVWQAAKRLHTALAGNVLVLSDLRVPRYATADLTGRRVLDVTPRGKHLLTR